MSKFNCVTLGFLLALILFGFNTPFLPKFSINYQVSGSQAEWLGAIATFLAVLMALFGDKLKEAIFPPRIEIIEWLGNIQENRNMEQQGHTRLLFENKGEATAEDVIVYVNRITDNGIPRQDFLPVPLPWTHNGQLERKFHKHQRGYLDLCRIDDLRNPTFEPKLVLIAGSGIPTYEDVRSGTTILNLSVCHKAGKNDYSLTLTWKRGVDKFVKVKEISKI